MNPRLLAAAGALYAYGWSGVALARALSSSPSVDVAWTVTAVFTLLWSALLLTAAACGRATAVLATLAGAVALAQCLLAAYTFNGLAGAGVEGYLPVIVLSAIALLASYTRSARTAPLAGLHR